ncbi:MAG: IclR family transcriptional regulator [Acidimicrobiia bacterium]|nr:IclR family transcriptional regulator [Acidimicrobiia bacterium]
MDTTLSGVGVLDKSVAVLRAVAEQPRSLADLVTVTGIARATAHRLAAALEVHGLVRRDGEGRYMAGPALIGLGNAAASSVPVAAAAADALEELRAVTGESVQLYVRQGDQRICVAALESPHGLRTIVPLGAALPLAQGSGGRVLQDGWAPNGEASWEASVGEREAGVASVSAPVRNGEGVVVAAISVSGPLDRTGPDPGGRYGPAVCAAARAVEQAAGWA